MTTPQHPAGQLTWRRHVLYRAGHVVTWACDGSWYFRVPGGETFDGFAGRIAAWLAEMDDRSVNAVTHGVVTRVMRGLYAGSPLAETLCLPVPQDRIYRLRGGVIEELGV